MPRLAGLKLEVDSVAAHLCSRGPFDFLFLFLFKDIYKKINNTNRQMQRLNAYASIGNEPTRDWLLMTFSLPSPSSNGQLFSRCFSPE